MNFPRRLALLLAAATLTLGARAAEKSERFSQAISREAGAAAGLPRLTGDETAVLDALVRRDAAQLETTKPTAPTFSQRLTLDEYRAAGLGRLDAAELVNLDALIAAAESPASAPLTASLLSAGPGHGAAESVRESAAWKPEMHGELFIEFGGGRGFSERAGGIALTLEDPTHHTALTVGYIERRLDVH